MIKLKDQETMKIVHDLKNPIIAIKLLIDQIDLDNDLKDNIN